MCKEVDKYIKEEVRNWIQSEVNTKGFVDDSEDADRLVDQIINRLVEDGYGFDKSLSLIDSCMKDLQLECIRVYSRQDSKNYGYYCNPEEWVVNSRGTPIHISQWENALDNKLLYQALAQAGFKSKPDLQTCWVHYCDYWVDKYRTELPLDTARN